jgi:hypothetical protein
MRQNDAKSEKIQLPIVFSLKLTDDDVPTNPDEPFAAKKRIAGAFLLDDEAGPFPLTLSDFEINRGHFNLQYNKLSTTGTPSPSVSLRFECDRRADGSCTGNVTSAQNGDFATFTMHRSSKNSQVLTAKPKYVGQWKGTMVMVGDTKDPSTPLGQINAFNRSLGLPEIPQDNDIGFYIGAADGIDPTNPSWLELDSTHRRIGSYWIGSNQLIGTSPFTTIIFDYFHRKVLLTYVNPAAPSVGASFAGFYDMAGNIASGEYETSSYGITGHFTAEKK